MTNEELKNIINKKFGHLSNKVDEICNRLNHDCTNINANDIFDITTTGMSYYDNMIQKNNSVEYFKTNKNLIFEIVYMSPEEYLDKSQNINKRNKNELTPSFINQSLGINPDIVEEYIERTLEGSKMPIPVLDYKDKSQEGRHRSRVALELGVGKIPVLVIRTYK